MRASTLALFVLALAGCSHAPSSGPGAGVTSVQPASVADRELARNEAELHRQESALVAAAAVAGPVDCDRARRLRDAICALAEKICAVAARSPDADPAGARCADARTRCVAARERVDRPCGSPAGPR